MLNNFQLLTYEISNVKEDNVDDRIHKTDNVTVETQLKENQLENWRIVQVEEKTKNSLEEFLKIMKKLDPSHLTLNGNSLPEFTNIL